MAGANKYPGINPEQNLAELEEDVVIRLRTAEIEFVPEEQIRSSAESVPVLTEKMLPVSEEEEEPEEQEDIPTPTITSQEEFLADARRRVEAAYDGMAEAA